MYGLEVYRAEIIQADERQKAKARALDALAPAIKAMRMAKLGMIAAQNMDGRGANDAIRDATIELGDARAKVLQAVMEIPEDLL